MYMRSAMDRPAVIPLPRQITVALDMAGCPNRCRHCYLGQATGGTMTPDDLRWTVAQFRDHVRPGDTSPCFSEITASSWLREPDFSPQYRALYALEQELSDGEPQRFELLSIHRLARDATYARWAQGIGTVACQISVFGTGATQDWFFRRRGAFDDCLAATEQLLAHGIAPRWQLFVTRRLLPELGDLLRLIDERRLRQCTAAIGRTFEVFLHTPAPDGEARQIEHLRPTLDEVAELPAALVETSRAYLGPETMWRTEAEWLALLDQAPSPRPFAYAVPHRLAFYVLPDWSVYTNIGTLEPWWRLGNLRADGVATILSRLERAEPLGLDTIYLGDPIALARSHADPQGQRIYDSLDELLGRYIGEYCVTSLISPASD